MKIIVNQFKEKHQDRVSIVKLIVESTNGLGLKGSKQLIDEMLEGKPMELDIDEDLASNFIKELERLNLDYKIVK